MTGPVSDDVDALAASFWRHFRAEGKSDRTAATYLQTVRFFARWCREQGDAPTVEALTRDRIRNWLASLAHRDGDAVGGSSSLVPLVVDHVRVVDGVVQAVPGPRGHLFTITGCRH
ncbi:phage integrase N-terminal SAM-like domain-containing protein [Actinomycetospora rhizophila]|uniref:Phage integrase N-terminal SAM-like domain-containing protein n=1 Tax=Actinomycetospora rhizophila TaxID=1416876 RepID=A0ABV9ZFK1_9PSEU